MVFCTWWAGKLCTSSAPAGEPTAPGRSALPCFAAESARNGTLMSLPEGIAASTRELARTYRGAGVLRRDIRVPEAKRGRVPCRNKEDTAPLAKTKKLNTKALSSKAKGFICARYWDRTSDLFRVREARYRCANRAHKTVVLLRGEDGIRTRVHGFAGRCLTTRPPHRIRSPRGTRSNSWSPYERLTRLELATSTLARWCSTN